jgi:hypothetical protein
MDQLMKKLLFAFAVIAILLPGAPQAKGQDASINFFYDNLSGGSWIEVGNYGYCWQPDIAASDPTWRPYADGYWAYTDDGWTWVSYEDFGWATYHYGRWFQLAEVGWVWVPGYEWGPAWVSWRFGGGYVGWAPLPPDTEVVYENRPLIGHLDVEFDIGPGYYNFVDVRYIGEPVLRSRIVDVTQNVTYINQTVNVTNITYKNKTVYNYGPDLDVVNQYSSRPIQKLKLEEQANVSGGSGFTKVQGNTLVIAAPKELKKPASPPLPPAVKTKIAQPKIEKGWSIAGDANAQAQLKEKIKSQNLKNIPPPASGPNAVTAGGPTSVSPAASLAPGTAPSEKGKRKREGAEQLQAAASASPSAGGAIGSPAATASVPERGKHKARVGEPLQAGATTTPVTAPSVAPEFGKQGKVKRGAKFGETASPAESATKPYSGGKGKMPPYERNNLGATPASATSPNENPNEPRPKHKQFEQEQPGTSPIGAQGAAPPGEDRSKRRAEGLKAPPVGGQSPAAQPAERKHEGKQKGAEGATPSPQ